MSIKNLVYNDFDTVTVLTFSTAAYPVCKWLEESLKD